MGAIVGLPAQQKLSDNVMPRYVIVTLELHGHGERGTRQDIIRREYDLPDGFSWQDGVATVMSDVQEEADKLLVSAKRPHLESIS